LHYAEVNRRSTLHKKNPGIHSTAQLSAINIVGTAEIGAFSYINEGTLLSSGTNSKVVIGKHCAIGRYVHISAKTHDLKRPTTDEHHPDLLEIEKDTIIGDYVWIGDKAFIREGIKIGDFAVVAANAVVNRDVLPFEIVGGIPIRHIRYNTEHYRYQELKHIYSLSEG